MLKIIIDKIKTSKWLHILITFILCLIIFGVFLIMQSCNVEAEKKAAYLRGQNDTLLDNVKDILSGAKEKLDDMNLILMNMEKDNNVIQLLMETFKNTINDLKDSVAITKELDVRLKEIYENLENLRKDFGSSVLNTINAIDSLNRIFTDSRGKYPDK